jgi:tetratricopeptide (TPR) repeat protein
MPASSNLNSGRWTSRLLHAALIASLLAVIGFRVYTYFATSESEQNSVEGALASTDVRDWFTVANRAFAAEEWQTSADVFGRIVQHEPDNVSARIRLGYSLHMLKRYDEALATYIRVSQHDGRPRQWAFYNIAAIYALKNEKRMALDYLQDAVESGYRQRDQETPVVDDPDFKCLADDPEFLRLAELTKPVSKREAYRQLDFLIGNWVLTSEAGSRVGIASLSEKSQGYAIIGDCIDDTQRVSSTLLFFYQPDLLKWRFTWLTDQGSVATMTGRSAEGNTFVFEGEQVMADGRQFAARCTLEETDNGAIAFTFEASADGGANWHDMFRAIFVRRTVRGS